MAKEGTNKNTINIAPSESRESRALTASSEEFVVPNPIFHNPNLPRQNGQAEAPVSVIKVQVPPELLRGGWGKRAEFIRYPNPVHQTMKDAPPVSTKPFSPHPSGGDETYVTTSQLPVHENTSGFCDVLGCACIFLYAIVCCDGFA